MHNPRVRRQFDRPETGPRPAMSCRLPRAARGGSAARGCNHVRDRRRGTAGRSADSGNGPRRAFGKLRAASSPRCNSKESTTSACRCEAGRAPGSTVHRAPCVRPRSFDCLTRQYLTIQDNCYVFGASTNPRFLPSRGSVAQGAVILFRPRILRSWCAHCAPEDTRRGTSSNSLM